MKNLFALTCFAFHFWTAAAQDLIVTQQHDSIRCEITDTDSNNLYYKVVAEDGNELYTQIPRNLVSRYKLNYYTRIEGKEVVPGREFAQLIFSLNGGYSLRTAKTPEGLDLEMEEYVESLKSGYHFGADLTYFFHNSFGIGFQYSTFRSKELIDGYPFPVDRWTVEIIDISDDITIRFIGPILALRYLNPVSRNAIVLKGGVGFMRYKDVATVMDYYTLNGKTTGGFIDLGYDLAITDNFSLGAHISEYIGFIREFELSNGNITETIELEEEDIEGLGRLDLSVRLNFTF